MKQLILLLFLLFSLKTIAADCSAISRTNNGANAVLTSAKYNADHNTAYTGYNDLVGSTCTIPFASVNQTDLNVQVNAIKQGCLVTRSNASTLTVDRCWLTVNGNNVRTTSATTVSFGCTGCSSEVASTSYFLFAKTGSSGSTLDLLITTSAPNNDGYNGSSDTAIGRFYNNASSDIDEFSIDQWRINKFRASNTEWSSPETSTIKGVTTDPTKGTIVRDRVIWRRIGDSMEAHYDFEQSGTGTAGSGNYLYLLPGGFQIDQTNIDLDSSFSNIDLGTNYGGRGIFTTTGATDAATIKMFNPTNVVAIGDVNGVIGSGIFPLSNITAFSFRILVPIDGWKN